MFEQQEKVIVLCLNSRLEVIKEKPYLLVGITYLLLVGESCLKKH